MIPGEVLHTCRQNLYMASYFQAYACRHMNRVMTSFCCRSRFSREETAAMAGASVRHMLRKLHKSVQTWIVRITPLCGSKQGCCYFRMLPCT